MKILIQGWTELYHSYAIVNCFHLYYFHKYYPSLTIYVDSVPYASPKWNQLDSSFPLYPPEMKCFLESLEPWNNEPIDLIFRIAYPYNISCKNTFNVPILIFYTAELKQLHLSSFTPNISTQSVFKTILNRYKQLFFVSPSEWNQHAFYPYNLNPLRNIVIPHGVDPSIFYRDPKLKSRMRSKYKLPSTSIIFLHAGAMTRSKGIEETLYILYNLIIRYKRDAHLVLKCSDSLYGSSTFVTKILKKLSTILSIPKYNMDQFMTHITFITHPLSFLEMNELYNGCDVYCSPYSAEGFNLIPLEALTAGCKLIITDKGSANTYLDTLDPIKINIIRLPSKLVQHNNGTMLHTINRHQSMELVMSQYHTLESGLDLDEYTQTLELINSKFTWKHVVDQYYTHFCNILDD